MASTPSVGQPAPEFTLPGVVLADPAAGDPAAGDPAATRADFALSAERGRPVVLAFYPGDETAVCTKQLCAYSSGLARFNALGAVVWGISPQGVDSHEKFARKEGLTFPLLADTDRAVVRAYGIALPGLGLRRSVFIVDGQGILRWKHVGLLGLTYSDVDTITGQLAAL
ncbi:MAG: peroxiredoxin [Frankia sp.]